jgi:hypothetical protein
MINYQLTSRSDIIKRLPDNAYIPCVESNVDYQAYLAWLAQGNEPLPPDPEASAE